MPPRIYRSFFPPLPPDPYLSIFSYAFPHPSQNPYPPSLPAYIDARTGTTLTHSDVRRLALEVAYGLTDVLPRLASPTWDGLLKRGDAIVLFSPNTLAFPLALHGALAAGLVVSPANSGYRSHELLYQFKDSRSKLIFAHPALVGTALDALKLAGFGAEEARARVVVCDYRELGGPIATTAQSNTRQLIKLEDFMSKGSLFQEADFGGEKADETALLCYSSGTTGKPKGVMSTHKNMVSVARMVRLVPMVAEGPQIHGAVLPFFHAYGLSMFLLIAPNEGRPVVVFDKFDALHLIECVARYRITLLYIVPPIVLSLIQHPAAEKYDLSSLSTVVSGAAPLGGPIANALMEKMTKRGAKNIAIQQGYGLTETSPIVTITPREWADRKHGSCGCLISGVEVRLVEEDGVTDAPEGEPGELWARGPNIMKGYLNNEAATRDCITADGWFKTGDIATRDSDGFFAIVDRKKELIKYKGFQVPPAELESVLLQHPTIVDAAVVGVEDHDQATELPRAYVVPAESITLHTAADKDAFSTEVQKWIQGRVAKHKYLRGGCVVIDTIPKSASGKILRKDLRVRAAEERFKEITPRAKL